jgi:endoglucanase
MENFDTALLNPMETSLQPLVQPLLGIESNAGTMLSSVSKDLIGTSLTGNFMGAALPGSAYKMPLGRDALTGQAQESFFAASGITAAVAPRGFIHQQGDKIVDGKGLPMTFKGIAFGNEVWDNASVPRDIDHTAIDFQRVKDMGMNSVRFYLNYKWFEDDSKPYEYKATAWQWLDKNIAWAKQQGISLILNMHIPQGGFQSQGAGDALWNNPANQQRLTALWTTIADRYRNETAIAGYGLVNEPIVTRNKQQWQTLAQNIANGIRQVDRNHLLFVEAIIGIKNPTDTSYRGTADQNAIKINDSNTAYEFHYYGPYEFTHQGFTWGYDGDGGKYPDYNHIENTQQLDWYTATFDNPTIAPGNTPWKYFEGVKYKITDPKIKAAIPVAVGANLRGTVSYDDIVIKEFDPTGKLTTTFPALNTNSPTSWGFWSGNNSGTWGTTTSGHNDSAALTITGTTGDANINNYYRGIITKPGYFYQISGWMKGENVAPDATARLRLDFQTSSKPLQVRNKAFLTSELQPYIDWGKKNQVPLYLGEFGAGINAFKANKGGLTWVNDVIDIAAANKLSFNYHSYHGDDFDLYFGSGKIIDPNKVNLPLKQLFTTKLRNLK